MKCKHNEDLAKCGACLGKVLSHLVKGQKMGCKCYANAFVMIPSATATPVIRTLTQAELTEGCLTIPLTSSCSTGLLQIGGCKSPENKWCRIVDQANGFITSLQVPKGCCGCYNFDLSASVGITATVNTVVVTPFSVIPPTPLAFNVPLQVTADLKLCEQLPREVCVADEVADVPEHCFTSVTFPIIDTPCASETLNGTDLNNLFATLFSLLLAALSISQGTLTLLLANFNFLSSGIQLTNLAVSGTVCLRNCQRLVPCLTLRAFDVVDSLTVTVTGEGTSSLDLNSISLTNIQLHLSCLSLKLVKIGECAEDCACRAVHAGHRHLHS